MALVSIGPREIWSKDGHDKLSMIGFPVYRIWDVWSGKWLGLWVVPNNQLKKGVTYLYLMLIDGGMPDNLYLCCQCFDKLVRDANTDNIRLWLRDYSGVWSCSCATVSDNFVILLPHLQVCQRGFFATPSYR
jgi:hypothetical protein